MIGQEHLYDFIPLGQCWSQDEVWILVLATKRCHRILWKLFKKKKTWLKTNARQDDLSLFCFLLFSEELMTGSVAAIMLP